MKRYGSMIRLRPEKYDEYKRLHAAAWPEILAKITECGIRNYSIYHKDGLLFSYFESLVSGYKSNNSIWLKSPAPGFLNSFFISSSCKEIFSNG